jgi:hypothetical protein
MSRKKKSPKNLFENMSVEPDDVHRPDANSEPSAETNPALPESTEGESESQADEMNLVEADEESAAADEPVAEPSAEKAEKAEEVEDTSADDLLEDVRRSLIEEEETREKEEQPKWWKRIGKGSRKTTSEPEAAKAVEEINLPNLESEDTVSAPTPETESEEYLDDIDELIDLLETEETQKNNKLMVVEETPPEPEKVVDLEELKKQAFQPRQNAATEQSLSEVRSIALEGDEEVFVEVQSTPQDPLEERISAVENALTPYRRYINFLVAFIGLIMAVVAGAVIFNIYRQSVAASAPTEVPSNIPLPTSVALPGGWTFKLAKGSLVDGNWNPKGAEWLTGTEVCRWVALPWSEQLEAVIRTLNPDDPIHLGMSNNDTLTYKVYSIQQMSPAQMQELDSNKPCLLVVLAEPEAEKRWVLTSLP